MNTPDHEEEEELPIPTIQNTVATCDVGVLPCTLADIAKMMPFSDYNSTRFAAVVVKLRHPSVTCLLFSSGKVVITGARCETHARRAATRLVSTMNAFGVHVSYHDFRVQNVVAAVFCPFFVDLPMLCERLQGLGTYDPCVFPGVVYRLRAPNKMAILIFASGKCVISGGRHRQQVAAVWEAFYRGVVSHCLTCVCPRFERRSTGTGQMPMALVPAAMRALLQSTGAHEDDGGAIARVTERAHGVGLTLARAARHSCGDQRTT